MRVLMIPFRTFREKIRLTKYYEKLGRIQIIDDKYIYVEFRKETAI